MLDEERVRPGRKAVSLVDDALGPVPDAASRGELPSARLRRDVDPSGPATRTSRSASPDQLAVAPRNCGVPCGSTLTVATFAFVAVPPLPSVAVTETVKVPAVW